MSDEIHTRALIWPFMQAYHSILRTQAFMIVQRYNEQRPESEHLGWRFDPDTCRFSLFLKAEASPEDAETIDLKVGEVALQGTGIVHQAFLAFLIVAEQRSMVEFDIETTASRSFLESAFEIARLSEPWIKKPNWMRAAYEAMDLSELPDNLDFRK